MTDAEAAGAAEAGAASDAMSEAEKMFREAYEAEMERSKLLQSQLEAALREKLGLDSGASISLQAKDVQSPLDTGGRTTWRQAYDAAKQRTSSLEEQLKKARGIGEAPPPQPAPEPSRSGTTSTFSRADDDIDKETADALRGAGVSNDQLQQVRQLREVSDMAADEEAVLRLIAVAVLPNRGLVLGEEEDEIKDDALPSLSKAREAVDGDAFTIKESVAFDRCYVFRGSIPSGVKPGDAVQGIQRRLKESNAPGAKDTELFLQPTKDENKSMLIMLLNSDLPSKEIPWWQWFFFGLLLLTTFLAANSTSFSVVPITAQMMANPAEDIDAVMKIIYKCLPTAAGILATVAAQESARRAVAAKYEVELSPPFLLPAWPFPSVGCLGAVTRRLSPAPNREAEFAMSAAAAIAGYTVSIGLIVAGLSLGPETDPVVNLNYQLLPVFLRVLIKPFLGTSSVANQPDPFMDPINIAYPANPVLIGGIVGLIVVSLSLLPIGRLDGGVLARQSIGSKGAGPLGLLGFVLLIIGSFAPDDAGTLYLTFGITTLIWQSGSEMPPREAVSDIGDGEKALGIVLLAAGFLLSIPGWAFPTI